MNLSLSGEVADPANLPSGCSFHPRCGERLPKCSTKPPSSREQKARAEPAGWTPKGQASLVPQSLFFSGAMNPELQIKSMVVAFGDLSLFRKATLAWSDLEVFGGWTASLRKTATLVQHHGGSVIKFIGDGGLYLFPGENADGAVQGAPQPQDHHR